jgi:hypothetical protein
MEYDNDNLLSDFASRTMENLKVIEERAKQGDAYEVTQLVNSFLGLFVFAQQSGAMPDSINLGGVTLGNDEFSKFRNAIAHFHILQVAEKGKITGLKLWNEWKGEENWRRDFTIDQLRSLVDEMHNHLTRH